MHFFTDRNFNSGKAPELENVRIYNIVGADLAEKGRILLIAAEIFSDTTKIMYYSPYEKELPCALHLPELNTLVACSYNSCSPEKLGCRTFDIARVLNTEKSPFVEEIAEYTMNQSRIYAERSMKLIGVADLLLKEYIKSGSGLLMREKVCSYAARKTASLLEKREGKGKTTEKSVSAVTCNGYSFSAIPPEFRVIRLCDNYASASLAFVKTAAITANRLGYDAVCSRAVDSAHSSAHLLIPDAGLMFVSEQSDITGKRFVSSPKINLERYYNRELLDSREHDVSFYKEYIRRLYNESALCARFSMDIKAQGRKLLIPYISERAVEEIAAEIVSCILNSN